MLAKTRKSTYFRDRAKIIIFPTDIYRDYGND